MSIAGCGDDDVRRARDAGTDARTDAGAPWDAGEEPDARMAPDGGDADAGGAFDAGPEPTGVIGPVPGEATILQIDLPTGLIPKLGEAAALVGPDGTLVLMDVGNDNHDDDVRAVVEDLNTRWITRAHGFPRDRGAREVDWIVVSHYHADHVGGLEPLLTGGSAVTVTQGIVHRGFTDLGPAVSEPDVELACDLLRGTLGTLDIPLCAGASEAPCTSSAWTGTYPASQCDALRHGNLADPLDDTTGTPAYIDLGDGARMTFIGANAHVSDGAAIHAMTPFGVADTNEENARSVIAIVSYARFRYHWGGDLTGSGDAGEPDVESHLAAAAGDAWYGALGMDVVHAHHHMRQTSSNPTFVLLTAPSDGRSRNVVGGINGAYLGSPYASVLAAWGDGGRLGAGRMWITDAAAGGATHVALVDSGATVIVQTLAHGRGYRVQAARATPESRAFATVR